MLLLILKRKGLLPWAITVQKVPLSSSWRHCLQLWPIFRTLSVAFTVFWTWGNRDWLPKWPPKRQSSHTPPSPALCTDYWRQRGFQWWWAFWARWSFSRRSGCADSRRCCKRSRARPRLRSCLLPIFMCGYPGSCSEPQRCTLYGGEWPDSPRNLMPCNQNGNYFLPNWCVWEVRNFIKPKVIQPISWSWDRATWDREWAWVAVRKCMPNNWRKDSSPASIKTPLFPKTPPLSGCARYWSSPLLAASSASQAGCNFRSSWARPSSRSTRDGPHWCRQCGDTKY